MSVLVIIPKGFTFGGQNVLKYSGIVSEFLGDYSPSFELWRTKSRTSGQYIATIHTPKERSDLALQSLVKQFVKIPSK